MIQSQRNRVGKRVAQANIRCRVLGMLPRLRCGETFALQWCYIFRPYLSDTGRYSLMANAESRSTLIRNASSDLYRESMRVASVSSYIPKRLHDFFERSCDLHADSIALQCGDDTLTYAELNRRANQLANHLSHLSVRPGDRVGLLLERSTSTYVGAP